MKLKILALLIIVASMLAVLTACELPFDIPFLSGGEQTPDEPDEGEEEEKEEEEKNPSTLEGLVLVENGKANFQIAYTANVGADVVARINKLITQLRSLGVEVPDPVSAAKKELVTDCEILIGHGISYRGDECSVNYRDLGEKGYVIKAVGKRVVIAGGNKEMTLKALELFIRNYMRITDKTKDIGEGIAIDETLNVLVPTTYFIDSFKIDGTDLSEYTIVYDIDRMADFNTGVLDEFREKLYLNTGIYLGTSDKENGKNIVFRCVDEVYGDTADFGFGAYVKDGSLYVECAYDNAFESAFENFAKKTIYDVVGSINLDKNFKYYSENVSCVYYTDFGAVGDGKTDDFKAILSAHQYANQCGQKVYGDVGATYYINEDFKETIFVKTNVDFNGATFIINDFGDAAYETRTLPLFTWLSDIVENYSGKTLTEKFGEGITLAKGDTTIPWLAGKLETKSLVVLWNKNKKDFNRYGANANGGADRHEVMIVEKDGTIDPDTIPVFDFTEVTKVEIRGAEDTPLTVENGKFRNICCQTVAATAFKAVYHSYHHGFSFQSSNVTAINIDHMMIEEPDLNVTATKDKNGETKANTAKYGTRDESYPYTGWFSFRYSYNCTLKDSKFDAHTVYYEDKTTSANPVAMGTYDYGANNASHVYLINVEQYVDDDSGIADAKFWGIMGTNGAKNLHHKNVTMNRFDAHAGFWNGSLIDTTIGRCINIIGGGTFLLENVTRVGDSSNFMDMRSDYGSTFDGDLILKDCTFLAHYGYNTAHGDKVNTTPRDGAARLLSTGFTNASEEYLAWDFGYTCYLPQNITIENFTYKSPLFYIFPDIPDAVFANNYGTPYVCTKSVTFINMDPLPLCSKTSLNVLNSIPVKVINTEEK